jgi:electron transfer flavoprotein alpha subunit
MNILIIAEHDHQSLKPATLSVMTAAKQLSSEIVLLVAGHNCATVAEQAAKLKGVKKILLADAPQYAHALAENIAPLAVTLSENFAYMLTPATAFGKNLLPRIAALLDVAQISDVIKIISPDTFVRPIYAGNALATVQSQDHIKLLTIRTTAYEPTELQDSPASIETINHNAECTTVEWISQKENVQERPELTTAQVVISGGRGLGSAENFKRLEKIADKLGAAIGASRAAVDAGFAPNDCQVGQTGKVVAPDLYIAVGISGAIQHVAGMKDSKVIVAINQDPDAAIFQIADYGLVGDLFKILPELEKLL